MKQAAVFSGAPEPLPALFTEGHARSAVGVAELPLNAAGEVAPICKLAR
ncbi:MAG: hypothetical protein GX167_07210 [Firmicutes bacterium]|nr:hypothetical protein [Bacillota bacterium]